MTLENIFLPVHLWKMQWWPYASTSSQDQFYSIAIKHRSFRGSGSKEIQAKTTILAGRSSCGKLCFILVPDSAWQPALNLSLDLPDLFQHIPKQICFSMGSCC